MWCSGSYEHICLRGRGLILVRRGMHVRMRMSFVGGEMRKTVRELKKKSVVTTLSGAEGGLTLRCQNIIVKALRSINYI
jgi:hypothetical protein